MCWSHQRSQSSGSHQPKSQSSFSCKDHHELEARDQYDDSKWYAYKQESVHIQFTTKHLYCTKQTNVAFDDIGNENLPRVLVDLQVAICNGTHDSLYVHDVNDLKSTTDYMFSLWHTTRI